MSSRVFTDVKRFMDYILKKSYALQLVNTLMLIALCFYTFNSINSINHRLDELENNVKTKIDHRYFNVTRSLEDIHNVRIDTFNGGKRQ